MLLNINKIIKILSSNNFSKGLGKRNFMEEKDFLFPQNIYSEHLATINGVNFTHREIDVISCLLNARRTNQIASILSIAPRTVTTHFRNIMLRLGCNSQEGIINFIERSSKLSVLRDYYTNLIIESAFKKSLKEIAKLKREEDPKCLIVYWQDLTLKNALIHYLGNHLKQAGIRAEIQDQAWDQKVKNNENQHQLLVLLIEKKIQTEIPQELSKFDSLDVSENQDYYLVIFEILKKFFWSANFDKIFQAFKECIESITNTTGNGITSATNSIPSQVPLEQAAIDRLRKEIILDKEILDADSEALIRKNISFTKVINSDGETNITAGIRFKGKSNQPLIKRIRKFTFTWVFQIISVFILGFLVLKYSPEKLVKCIHTSDIKQEKKEDSFIRSDLVIPTESSFLSRPELIAQLKRNFKDQNGIQAVALVGPGGAGKTTLARQYAHQQKSSVIWEINAEAHEGLTSSFESLVEAFAKKDNDKKILQEIQIIKDTEAKERKIIQFVKRHLNSHPNWFLIFDNVESFANIQKYFPQDVMTWGLGKIILTTRDKNIENNKHVSGTIQIGELTSQQKVHLFTKIMTHQNQTLFTPIQAKEVKLFLEHIPSFPLDVSIAAYYLKATQIPYATYLENLTKFNKDFESIQQDLLKEAGDYTKTRYGIMALSLEYIINAHKDFKNLLLFISLLDSQNIPRDLLDQYKDKAVVDNFIYHLKKYSFITTNSINPPSSSTFSIHRTTQAIILTYITKGLNLEGNKKLIHPIANTLMNYVSSVVDKENFSRMKVLVSHCEAFLNHNNQLTNTTTALISGELGCLYFCLGNYEKAKQLLENSFIKLRKYNSGNHSRIARILEYFGIVHRELGNYVKARYLFEQSLTIYKKHFSKNHADIAQALAFLGDAYRNLGDYEKAKNLLEQSCTIYKKNFCKNYIVHARALSYLGIVYRELGKYEKSKDLLEESLLIHKKHFADDHAEVAWVLTYLGDVYRELGNYEKAKNLLEEGLLIHKKQFFENHVDVAWILTYLGEVYQSLGDYKKAKDTFEQALIIYKKHFPENHVRVAWVLAYLGNVYKALDQSVQAKKSLERSLEIHKKHFKEGHLKIARILSYLGNAHKRLGNYEKAKDFFERCLIIYNKNYGKDHIKTAQILRDLGQVYLLEGRLEIAENLIYKALGIFQQKKHPESYTALEHLTDLYLKKSMQAANKGDMHQSQKFKIQAINYSKQAIEIVKARFPKGFPHILKMQCKFNSIK